MSDKTLYQIDLIVPQKSIGLFEQALDSYADAVSMELIEQGANKGMWKVSAIFEKKPDLGPVSSAISVVCTTLGIDEPAWTLDTLANKNWLQESLQNFPPLDLGAYYVYGSHLTDLQIPQNKIALKIDAATAFGSGKHATTQGCLQAFEEQIRKLSPHDILDLGCGSGILAMAAAKVLPDACIDAADIDPESVRVTQQNIVENQVSENITVFQSEGFQHVTKQYDLIFANILARPLIDMASDMYQHLKTPGFAILSGFLNRQRSWLVKAYEAQGFTVVKNYKVKEWGTVIVKRT